MPVILPLYCAVNVRIVYCIFIDKLSSLELRHVTDRAPIDSLVWYLCEMAASFTYHRSMICTVGRPASGI